jgi:hypothetical protein
MSNWKDEFVECLEGPTVKDSQMEKAFAIWAICEPRGVEVLEMHRADESFKLFPLPFSQ